MKKLIFLDIDGVLNCESVIHDSAKKQHTSYLSRCESQIDKDMVARLNRLIFHTNAEVVISSSWRILHSLSELVTMLRNRGFTGDVVGYTPSTGKRRGYDIQAYLDTVNTDVKFIILDDDSDMEHLSSFLIQTSWKIGLTDKHVEEAIERLGDD